MDYKKLYTTLYEEGYHIDELTNIGKGLVNTIVENYEFTSILDVGCSNGLAVMEYKKNNKNAFGIDVSEIAIKKAQEFGLTSCIQSSVTEIPFERDKFEALVSSDVLEHLEPEDVLKALGEVNRVASKYLFLQIAKSKEGVTKWIDLMKEKHPDIVENIDNLHLSVFPNSQWITWVESFGKFKFKTRHKKLMVFERI